MATYAQGATVAQQQDKETLINQYAQQEAAAKGIKDSAGIASLKMNINDNFQNYVTKYGSGSTQTLQQGTGVGAEQAQATSASGNIPVMTPTSTEGNTSYFGGATSTSQPGSVQKEPTATTPQSSGGWDWSGYDAAMKSANKTPVESTQKTMGDFGLGTINTTPKANNVVSGGKIPFTANMTTQQQDGIQSLVNDKPVSQWSEEDKKNWNTATGGAPLPTEGNSSILDGVMQDPTKDSSIIKDGGTEGSNLPTGEIPQVDMSSLTKYMNESEKLKADYANQITNFFANQKQTYQSNFDNITKQIEGLAPEYAKAFADYQTKMQQADIMGGIEMTNNIRNQMMIDYTQFQKDYTSITGNDPSSKYRQYNLIKSYNGKQTAIGATMEKIQGNNKASMDIINGYYDRNIQSLEGQRLSLTTAGNFAKSSLDMADRNYNKGLDEQLKVIDSAIAEEKKKKDIQDQISATDKYTYGNAVNNYGLNAND